jgi:hypothetical protein
MTRRDALKAAAGCTLAVSVAPADSRMEPDATGQPEPLLAFVSQTQHATGWTTAVARVWEHGAAARCRLCPAGRCTAVADVCLVAVNRFVGDDEAVMLDLSGATWPDDAEPGEA